LWPPTGGAVIVAAGGVVRVVRAAGGWPVRGAVVVVGLSPGLPFSGGKECVPPPGNGCLGVTAVGRCPGATTVGGCAGGVAPGVGRAPCWIRAALCATVGGNAGPMNRAVAGKDSWGPLETT